MDVTFSIFSIIVLIFSVVIHEVSHGYAALFEGDRTAEMQGRLTLNPLKHIDLFGSIIVPALCALFGGFMFGWAKPVPINPYNFRNQKWGEAIVAFAGPLSNIILALIFGLILRFDLGIVDSPTGDILGMIVLINLTLAIFNLIPIPPLDGSRIFFSFLPAQFNKMRALLDRYGLIIIFLLIFILAPIASVIVQFFFTLLTGISI
ncbi:MAG TPA: site-2 protease family protein [Candidatus Paceibacterota bacterium]|nr:site-2 protease family protein [Candidatus Paceibacterota bacterium]